MDENWEFDILELQPNKNPQDRVLWKNAQISPELDAAYVRIQELEETLEQREDILQSLHQAHQDDTETIHRLKICLRKSKKQANSAIEMLQLKVNEAHEEKEASVKRLREHIDLLKAKCSRYDQNVNKQVESAQATTKEQEACIQNLKKTVQEYKLETLTLQSQLQEAKKEAESSKQLLKQTLEEALKKNDMLEMKLGDVSEDRERLKEQVKSLKAKCQSYDQVNKQVQSAQTTIKEQDVSIKKLNNALHLYKQENQTLLSQLHDTKKEAEGSEKLFKQKKTLEEALLKKDTALLILESKLREASEDTQTVQCLTEEVEVLKAKCQGYEKTLHTQRSTLEFALTEQTQRATQATTKAEELEKSLQDVHSNTQALKRHALTEG